ncbi:MAG TPA: cob(I)yrinic acid a,c-diamide adenosyltransferase [Candidatus Omnitrophota bacterium]|nr:cob(I)yrinic acid a,c-diamide adenosyltransferase [Candidatus Omnitrophota bacterium]
MKKQKNKGLIIVFTGNGKGKTTAALGVAMRMIGHGKKVVMVQFLKSGSGESQAAKKFGSAFKIWSLGKGFTWQHSPAENKKIVREAWRKCREILKDPRYALAIFDEINYCMEYKLLDPQKVIQELRKKTNAKHVILTGNGLPGEILDVADLVTEMKCIRHPFQNSLPAQAGIEF